MNQRRQRFWQRILERHRYNGRLLRPRVPLVLRVWRAGQHGERRTALPSPHVTQYALNLHLHLRWPFVSVPGNALHHTHLHSNSARNFLWLTPAGTTSRQTYSSLCNLSVLCASVVDHRLSRITTETQRTQRLHRETRKLIELQQQANVSRNVTHESRTTNQNIEVQEARKIFAGMVLQHSSLTTQKITTRLGTVSTTRDTSLVRSYREREVLSTHAVSPAVPAVPRLDDSQSPGRSTKHEVIQHTKTDFSRSDATAQRENINAAPLRRGVKNLPPVEQVNRETPISLPQSTVENPPPGGLSATPSVTSKANSNGPGALTAALPASPRVLLSTPSITSKTNAIGPAALTAAVPAIPRVLLSTPSITSKTNAVGPGALTAALPAIPRVLLSTPSSKTNAIGPGALTAAPPPLYTQPATRNFATQPTRDEDGSQSQERTAPAASPQSRTPAPQQPSLDIARLTDEVYRHIQRKIRVERERRGL